MHNPMGVTNMANLALLIVHKAYRLQAGDISVT